ncbi:hypothetical protein QR680_000821 [Steinernema hermaphroditum]|uniref:Uncharacterized protein n=1 Tax=Steinernema hermaphroditum TaxID=289476 RepID=A0AA39GXI9_9BILA|nr:hypothetical protein QR680_000821 [Steinernema hermaphroditum]
MADPKFLIDQYQDERFLAVLDWLRNNFRNPLINPNDSLDDVQLVPDLMIHQGDTEDSASAIDGSLSDEIPALSYELFFELDDMGDPVLFETGCDSMCAEDFESIGQHDLSEDD